MNIKLPFLIEDVDRHGNVRVYVRLKGRPKARIRALPGTDEFLDAYRAAVDNSDPRPDRTRRGTIESGTIAWLGRQYELSSEFRRLEPRSQRVRSAILASCFAEPLKPGSDLTIGQVPIQRVETKHIKVLRDRKSDTPGAANNRLDALRRLFAWAIEAEVGGVQRNVARDVKPLKYATSGFHTWSIEEVRQFEARHPVGSKARLAMALLLYTGQRRSDVVLLGRQHLRKGFLVFQQQKTRKVTTKLMELPVLPELEAIIHSTSTGDLTFLVTDQARPKAFTSNGFGNRFREWCDQAGLRHCSAHGLRKAGACIAAENGATEKQLMAIFGWEEARQAAHYTKGASQKRLAAAAMHLLVPRSFK